MVEMRKLAEAGYLGGPAVHMESLYCYELGDPAYAKAMLGDPDHWARKLPGSLLQNIMSHGVARIAEFMLGDEITVLAHGFSSPFLQAIGHGDIVDELRLMVRDEHATTAYFTFSSQISPSAHRFTVCGPKRTVVVDDDHQVVLRLDSREYKSYLRFFVPPVSFAGTVRVEPRAKRVEVPAQRLPSAQRRGLVAPDYGVLPVAWPTDAPPPIPYREILLTSRIMDAALAQMGRRPARAHDTRAAAARRPDFPITGCPSTTTSGATWATAAST